MGGRYAIHGGTKRMSSPETGRSTDCSVHTCCCICIACGHLGDQHACALVTRHREVHSPEGEVGDSQDVQVKICRGSLPRRGGLNLLVKKRVCLSHHRLGDLPTDTAKAVHEWSG